MSLIKYKISDFEGPLDLLLALIRQNKMSIADIEILTVINQYLDVINSADQSDLDEASEFIDMAARLIYMKSVFLLPKDKETEKLKAELQGRLIEYSLAKKARRLLKEKFIGDKIFTRPAREITVDYTYANVHRVETLVNVYSKLSDKDLRRTAPAAETFEPIVSAPVVSVSSKIFSVLKGLMKNNFDSLSGAFRNMRSKSEAVATFLAVLELIRSHRITLASDGKMDLIRKESKK
ncbi:MAG: segregation/condensation protein A [Oscillospiraceae bacterium]|nr:segregation/condensation protein A [Oscillospiraceae bacterium]